MRKIKISVEKLPARKFIFLLQVFICLGLGSWAQSPEILNNYKSVFLPQLSYGGGKVDIYDIRKTVAEKLRSSGVHLFLSDDEISADAMQNPCSMLDCLIANTTTAGYNSSTITILFTDCKNDTILIYSAQAKPFRGIKETRNSFVHATEQALEPFNSYHHQLADSVASKPIVNTEVGEDSLAWTLERKLTWADFKGKATLNDPADALTYTANQTSFEGFSVGNRFSSTAEVTCYFIKTLSWVKEGKASDYLLNHEQRHFDLAEAGAREFRKKMQQAHFTSDNFNEASQKIAQDIHQKYVGLQQQYDSETNHSRIEEKQKEWNLKIDKMLRDLEEYK